MNCETYNKTCERGNINYLIIVVLYILLAIIIGACLF